MKKEIKSDHDKQAQWNKPDRETDTENIPRRLDDGYLTLIFIYLAPWMCCFLPVYTP